MVFSLLFQAFLVTEFAATFGECCNSTSSRLVCGLVLSSLLKKSVMIHRVRQKGWMVNQPGGRTKVKGSVVWEYYFAAPLLQPLCW